MTDEVYFRQRADNEARMAEAASAPRARAIHEELRSAYLRRADAAGDPDRRLRSI